MTENWLLIDIGNTDTVAGLCEASSAEHLHAVRFRTDLQCTSDEFRAMLRQLFLERLDRDVWETVDRVVISTVVPALEAIVEEACESGTRQLPFLSIGTDTPRDFELDLPHPEQLGSDRLANVAGALTLAQPPFLVVDAGTATTFCLVDHRPAYIGGAIVPGLEIGWKALQSRAAKLFSVELRHPDSALGNTTETQLRSGVLIGHECLVEGMTDRLLQEAGEAFQRATLFSTGGCTRLIRLSARFRFEPDLTLLGLFRYGQLTR
jgi:type III pantothenate kinase